MSLTAILDGDILVYQAASKAERIIQWDDDIWTLHANLQEGKGLLEGYIDTMVEKVGATDFNISVTIGMTFRHDLLPTYKGNRDPRKKPILVGALRQWVLDTYGKKARCIPPLEADDVMGILATNQKIIKGDRLIVSVDKDFKTIPGKFYDYGRDIWYENTEDDANWHWMLQTLMGDATDNYSGCPGIGPKTAEKLLPEPAPLEEMWEVVLAQFEKKGLGYDVAVQQARMARILRDGDYDFKTKEIKLWTPNAE